MYYKRYHYNNVGNRGNLLFVVLSILICLSGCSAKPGKYSQLNKLNLDERFIASVSESEHSLIFVYRNEDADTHIQTAFAFDGKVVGRAESKSIFAWVTPPGEHRIATQADNLVEIKLNTLAGNVYFVKNEVSSEGPATRVRLDLVNEDIGLKAIREGNPVAIIQSTKDSEIGGSSQDALESYPPLKQKPENVLSGATKQTGQEMLTPDQYPKVLSGEEIVIHFQTYRTLQFDITPDSREFTVKLYPNNIIERYCPLCDTDTGYGNMHIKASQDLVCFDWDLVTYPSSTCFQLTQIGKSRYQLIDPLNGETYGYVVP